MITLIRVQQVRHGEIFEIEISLRAPTGDAGTEEAEIYGRSQFFKRVEWIPEMVQGAEEEAKIKTPRHIEGGVHVNIANGDAGREGAAEIVHSGHAIYVGCGVIPALNIEAEEFKKKAESSVGGSYIQNRIVS